MGGRISDVDWVCSRISADDRPILRSSVKPEEGLGQQV
jgi:hypothetical protein